MAGHYHRAQILLEPEQYRKLKGMALKRGASVSSLVRELLAQGLESQARSAQARLEALERLGVQRLRSKQEYGGCCSNPVAEVRELRERSTGALLDGDR